jgi:hypothetical protein
MVTIESCEYRFAFDMRGTAVIFKAVRVDRGGVTDPDEQAVKECLNDIGKWETVKKTFSDLISGFGLAKNALDIKAYTVSAYNIETKVEEGTVKGSISLSKEERLLREGRGEDPISVEEIARQLRNVDRWRNLQRAVFSLRPQ